MTTPDHLRISLSRRRLVEAALGASLMAFGLPNSTFSMQAAGQYTFLGLGIDTREDNTDQRSDVIMVSRVNIESATVRTLSIPRDLYVESPGYGADKINSAYQYGLEASGVDWQAAANLTQETVSLNFGVTIDGFAVTDMNRFPAVIDAIGGVDVVNPYAFFDDVYFNRGFPAGELHLNGDEAMVFTRIRVPDGDGGRVMRQHLVLEAMLNKLQSPEILPRIPELITSLTQSVRTNISSATQAELIALFPRLSSESLAFTNIEPLLSSGYTAGGAWIYQADWSTLPGYVQAWLDGTIE
jgi:polyisoprenyl-teichoic acid--peptidoglycan teichoic acid transferase